jgi:hypothetical protein
MKDFTASAVEPFYESDRRPAPSIAIAAYKCAICNAVLAEDASKLTKSEAWSVSVQHTADCPGLPIRAGDHVRHEPIKGLPYADGVVLRVGVGFANVRITSGNALGLWGVGDVAALSTGNLRRIPRPAPESRGEALPLVARASPSVIRVHCHGKMLDRSQCHETATVSTPQEAMMAGGWRCAAHTAPPTVETPWMKVTGPPSDPLDVKYDDVSLRTLLTAARGAARDQVTPLARSLTTAQRAAVSAHWSAQLRAKLAASEAERKSREVSIRCEQECDEW